MANSKTVYDITLDQAHQVAVIALNDGTPEFLAKEVSIETPRALQHGVLIPISFRCWEGDIWLSSSNSRGMAMRNDEEDDQPLSFAQKNEIEAYLKTEGIW